MPSTSSKPTPARKSRIVILSLSSDILSRFPTAAENATSAPLQESSDSKTPEDNATPVPVNGDAQDANQNPADKKKKSAPTKKRAPPAIDPSKPPRPPQKKKKPDADNETDEAKQAANAANASAAHKLGPKANTGAINAGLRALDRSGKPCRRWEKKGLQLKSFTGSSWHMPTWKGSSRPNLNADGEVQSDASSDNKPVDASGLVSEKSTSAVGETTTMMMTGLESSPAPAIAA